MMQAVEYRFGASQTAPHEVERLSDNGSCCIASNTRSFARALSLQPITTPVKALKLMAWSRALLKPSNEITSVWPTGRTRLPLWVG
jgi:putative transposase